MNDKNKKMIAPVIIAVLFLAYLILYITVLMKVSDWKLIILAVPFIVLGGGMIYTLYSRIKEIRSGEEDDLDNY